MQSACLRNTCPFGYVTEVVILNPAHHNYLKPTRLHLCPRTPIFLLLAQLPVCNRQQLPVGKNHSQLNDNFGYTPGESLLIL